MPPWVIIVGIFVVICIVAIFLYCTEPEAPADGRNCLTKDDIRALIAHPLEVIMATLDDVKAEQGRESALIAKLIASNKDILAQLKDLRNSGGATATELDGVVASMQADEAAIAAELTAETTVSAPGTSNGQGTVG